MMFDLLHNLCLISQQLNCDIILKMDVFTQAFKLFEMNVVILSSCKKYFLKYYLICTFDKVFLSACPFLSQNGFSKRMGESVKTTLLFCIKKFGMRKSLCFCKILHHLVVCIFSESSSTWALFDRPLQLTVYESVILDT